MTNEEKMTVSEDQKGAQKLAALMAAGKGLKGFQWPKESQDLKMHIAKDGTWFHEDRPILRQELVKLFATILQRDTAGDYWLVTPAEKGRIHVEDAPFIIVGIQKIESDDLSDKKHQKIIFTTSLGHEISLGKDHPLRVEIDLETMAPAPYVYVRDDLEALINRACFYDLVEWADFEKIDDKEEFGIWSQGCFFSLGPTE